MTRIEYYINGRLVGSDASTRDMTPAEVRKAVRQARREYHPATLNVTVNIKHE